MKQRRITGYHYTNGAAYRSMQRKGDSGWAYGIFREFVGLIPGRRFIYDDETWGKLPKEANERAIRALLEPEPQSWAQNPEFPNLWAYLMDAILISVPEFGSDLEKDVVLLSFELTPEDRAFIVDRAILERELYKEAKGQGESTQETRREAFRRYWESRVPAFDYNGGYELPKLAIWSGIEFGRLRVEWRKPSSEVWDNSLRMNSISPR